MSSLRRYPSHAVLALSLCLVLMLSTTSAFQVPVKSVTMRPIASLSTQESPSALEMGAVEIMSAGAKAVLSLPKLIVPTFVKGFAVLFVWQMYSTIFKNSLKKGKFAAMQIVSETRENYGNATNVPDIASQLKEASEIEESFVRISGDGSAQGNIRVAGDVAFQYSDDGMKVDVYGRKEAPAMDLRELVSEKNTMMNIEEDVLKRMNWMKKVNECVPIKDSVEGSYTFCFRDYVNHEELIGMMWKRYGIEGFLFKPSRADVLTINSDSKCTLFAKSKMFRFVPISIEWEGELKEGAIDWTSTSLTMGWKKFGKFFDKPAAAEKLRKDPWVISVPKDDSTGDILCFDRVSVGNLVFAKDECLSGGVEKNQPVPAV